MHDPGLALQTLQQGVERGLLVRQRPEQAHQRALVRHLPEDPDDNLDDEQINHCLSYKCSLYLKHGSVAANLKEAAVLKSRL